MSLQKLSEILSPKIRGWINYYGRYHKSGMDIHFRFLNERISKWAFNKYKRFKRRKVGYYARKWMQGIAASFANMFPHWQHGFTR